jgi:hypothetical protein
LADPEEIERLLKLKKEAYAVLTKLNADPKASGTAKLNARAKYAEAFRNWMKARGESVRHIH